MTSTLWVKYMANPLSRIGWVKRKQLLLSLNNNKPNKRRKNKCVKAQVQQNGLVLKTRFMRQIRFTHRQSIRKRCSKRDKGSYARQRGATKNVFPIM